MTIKILFLADQGDSLGDILEIRVTDCYGAAEDGCEIPLGTTVKVEIDFMPCKFPSKSSLLGEVTMANSTVSASDIESLTTEVDGILGGVHLPWDQVEKYPFCDSLGLGQDCPLTAGKMVTYSEFLDVCLDYPPVSSDAIARGVNNSIPTSISQLMMKTFASY